METEKDNRQKGLKNLFLQMLQLKNFLKFLGGGGLFVLLYADIDAWKRVQSLFFIWSIIILLWFLFILTIYRGELANRILAYILSVSKKLIPLFLTAFSLYLILWPFELEKTFGTLVLFITYLFFVKRIKKIGIKLDTSLSDWVATETNNEQGTDFRELPLEGRPIKELEFKIKPNSRFWRAGFKITDPNSSVLPLRTPNSVLFHIASVEKESDKFGIVAYINGERVSCVNKILKLSEDRHVKMKFEVNKKNFIRCFISGNLEFKPKGRIDPRLLEKVFLAAWGDGNPYRVEFRDIKYKFRK